MNKSSLMSRGWILFCGFMVTITIVVGCGAPKTTTRVKESKRSGDATSKEPVKDDRESYAEIVGHQCNRDSVKSLTNEINLTIPAASYWVSSGLYVTPGDRVKVSAQGQWTIWKGETVDFGPDGHEALSMHRGCRKGSLVAQIGLTRDPAVECLGSKGEFVADRSGIVYFAMNDSASPEFHGGAINASVSADALRAPDVSYEDVEGYNYCGVSSGWVELYSQKHVILTVPADLVDLYQDEVKETLDFYDQVYISHAEFNGQKLPWGGQRLRIAPDFGLRGVAWVQASNPMLIDPANLNGVEPSPTSILRAKNPAFSVFEIVRGMGIGFSRPTGGRYQYDDNMAQAFGGIFALHTLKKLGRSEDVPEDPCRREERHLESGSFTAFAEDPWLQTCMLSRIETEFGAEVFARFFQSLPDRDQWDVVLPASSTREQRWAFVINLLSAEEGLTETDAGFEPMAPGTSPVGEMTSIFTNFHVPFP